MSSRNDNKMETKIAVGSGLGAGGSTGWRLKAEGSREERLGLLPRASSLEPRAANGFFRSGSNAVLRSGQSTMEYALFIVAVAAAVIAMNLYVKRSVQANLKALEDHINVEAVK